MRAFWSAWWTIFCCFPEAAFRACPGAAIIAVQHTILCTCFRVCLCAGVNVFWWEALVRYYNFGHWRVCEDGHWAACSNGLILWTGAVRTMAHGPEHGLAGGSCWPLGSSYRYSKPSDLNKALRERLTAGKIVSMDVDRLDRG